MNLFPQKFYRTNSYKSKNKQKEKVFEIQGYLKYPLGHKSLKCFPSTVQKKRKNEIKGLKNFNSFFQPQMYERFSCFVCIFKVSTLNTYIFHLLLRIQRIVEEQTQTFSPLMFCIRSLNIIVMLLTFIHRKPQYEAF